MIKIKKRLNEQEALRLSLMSIMVRNKRELLESNNYMGDDSERELAHFTKNMGWSRGEFIDSALSKRWPEYISYLQYSHMIPR